MENLTPNQTSSFRPIEKPSAKSALLDDAVRFADPTVIRGHVQQLHLLTSRIEEFLAYQISRLPAIETGNSSSQVANSADLDRLIDEFEQLRRNWESERQRETDRLRGDAERLQEAWRDLEGEQRDLLTRQAAIRTVGSAAAAVAPAAVPMAMGAMYPTRSTSNSRTAGADNQPFTGEVNSAPSHKAQIQFQQLRREMQKHAQQRNKR